MTQVSHSLVLSHTSSTVLIPRAWRPWEKEPYLISPRIYFREMVTLAYQLGVGLSREED